MTFLCQVRDEALSLEGSGINRTRVNPPSLTVCINLLSRSRPDIGIEVRMTPRHLDLNLGMSTCLLELLSLLGPAIRIIIATVC